VAEDAVPGAAAHLQYLAAFQTESVLVEFEVHADLLFECISLMQKYARLPASVDHAQSDPYTLESIMGAIAGRLKRHLSIFRMSYWNA